MADSGTYDQATLQRRAKIAEAMLADPKKPITHWAEGLNELAKGAIGGYQLNHIDELAKQQREQGNAELFAALGLPAPAAKPAEPSGFAKIGSLLGFGGGSTAAAAPDPVTASPESPAMTPAPRPPVTPTAPPPVSAPMGGSSATAMASSPDANLPRGYRNMNPGNIEDGPFARSQPGYAGSDGRFAKFASLDNGTGAMSSLLDSYGKRGLNTVNGIINRWAPSSDGNNVNAYAANVAQQLGIGPDDPIPPEMRPKLIAAMAQHENGMPLPSAGQPSGAPAGVAGAPPATGGANPVAAALANPAAAQPTQAGVLSDIPSDKKLQIAKMLTSSNPTVKALGMQMASSFVKKDPLDAEAKALDIATKKKALEAAPTVQRVKQPDGSEVAVQWDSKTGQWMPLKAPEGGNPVANPKLTEQQSKDVGFFNRGQKLLPRLEKQDQALTDLASTAGGSISNYFKTDKFRQAEQTGRELLAVILRKDTGAAVTPQEYSLYGDIYLPRPGDDMATVIQKRAARATAIEGLRLGLGPADIIFKSREAAEAAKAPQGDTPAPAAAKPATPAAPQPGTIMDGHRFKGGDPSKQENWEPVT